MTRRTHSNAQITNIMSTCPAFTPFYLDTHALDVRSDLDIPELHYKAEAHLEDHHLSAGIFHMSQNYGVELTKDKLWEVLLYLAHMRQRNPLVEKLNSLSWDGTARLDTFLIDFAGVSDNAYSRAVTSKSLIGAVARAMRPGCKMDNVLILEGVQGARKSTLIETLGSVAGTRYVLTSKVVLNTKDTLQNMASAWIVNIDEFASFRKAEVEELKAFVTQPRDKYRVPYAHLPRTVERRCIFMATINGTENPYLDDVTGGRRWWPVEVTKTIDLEAVKAIREQLWAEAVVRYKAGEVWYIDDNDPLLAHLAREQQAERQTADPWEATVSDFVARATTKFTQDDILQRLKIEVRDRKHADKIRVGKILTKLGLRGSRTRSDGTRVQYYDPSSLNDERRRHLRLVDGPVSPEEERFDKPQ